MKKFEILQKSPKWWHRDMKWANVVGKMAPVELLDAGLPQTFNFLSAIFVIKTVRDSDFFFGTGLPDLANKNTRCPEKQWIIFSISIPHCKFWNIFVLKSCLSEIQI